MRLLQKTNLPFVGIRYYAYAFSVILILAGLVGIITNGLNWSIDFTSGVAAKVNLKPVDTKIEPLKIDELRSILKSNG